MKKKNNTEFNDDLRPEYDLADLKGGVRGKYADRYLEGTNIVVLDPDVAAVFHDSLAVNQALRAMIKSGKQASTNCDIIENLQDFNDLADELGISCKEVAGGQGT